MRIFAAAAALCASIAFGATDEQKMKYEEWNAAMEMYGYSWEPYEVTTEDGFILTVMQVTGKDQDWVQEPTKNPVLYVPPMGSTPDSIMVWNLLYEAKSVGVQPTTLMLYDHGHPLYFLYSRGLRYSQQPNVIDGTTIYDKEYWQFSWQDIGQYDVPAAMEMIYDKHDMRVGLMGFSMGTTSLFAGLGLRYDDWYREHTYKVALESPCRIITPGNCDPINPVTVGLINSAGVYNLGGPAMFEQTGRMSKFFTREGARGIITVWSNAIFQNVTVQSLLQYCQNISADRFQTWSNTFFNVLGAEKTTQLMDVSQVTAETPVGLFVAGNDTTCGLSEDTYELMKDSVTFYKQYEGLEHGDFAFYTDPVFVNDFLTFFED